MKASSFIISSVLIAAPRGLQAAGNAVENLIRKRLDSPPNRLPIMSDKDEFFESFFGRLIEEESSHLFSFSFSYSGESVPPTSSPSIHLSKAPSALPTITVAPSSSPTLHTSSAPSVRGTPVPTPFSDSSNDETFGPSSSLTSSPSFVLSEAPSMTPSSIKSDTPSMTPTSNITTTPLPDPADDNEAAAQTGLIDPSIISDGPGPSSIYIISAIGVATGVVIFGAAMKAVGRQNPMQYRNLDGDSISSFSLQGEDETP